MSSDNIFPFIETLNVLKTLVPIHLQKPHVGIVCGSGLSTLADNLKDVHYVPYSSLPGFGNSTVQGHKSQLAFGLMGEHKTPVVAMLGRFHPYEGHKLTTVVYPIRVLARLGVKDIIVTNAAGSLNPDIPVGTIIVVNDHLALPNLTGPLNPLLGPLASPSYARFLPLSSAYSIELRRQAFFAAHDLSLPSDALGEGTYAWVSGPTYETAAEGRFLRAAGADVVGMSTVPEVVAAKDEGLNVLVLSLATNPVIIPDEQRSIKDEVEAEIAGRPVKPFAQEVVSHEDVLAIGRAKADVMRRLVQRIIERISSP